MATRSARAAQRVAAHEQALATAMTSPTEHVPRHITNREVGAAILGAGVVGRFNNWLAVQITRAVGSMWAAYVFVVIALISFPQALNAFVRGDTLTGVTWLSQSFLQLVLLPILMVGQRVISEAQDARAEADHETLTALHRINVQQLQILKMLERLEHKD